MIHIIVTFTSFQTECNWAPLMLPLFEVIYALNQSHTTDRKENMWLLGWMAYGERERGRGREREICQHHATKSLMRASLGTKCIRLEKKSLIANDPSFQGVSKPTSRLITVSQSPPVFNNLNIYLQMNPTMVSFYDSKRAWGMSTVSAARATLSCYAPRATQDANRTVPSKQEETQVTDDSVLHSTFSKYEFLS